MNMLDIMTSNVITVHETDTVATAYEIMKKANIRHVVVVQVSGRIRGIVSDRDCKLAAQSAVRDGGAIEFSDDVLVKQIMAPMPHCITPYSSVAEAAQLMLEYKISALPIMRDSTLMGIVTTTDLLKVLSAVTV